MAYLLNAKYDTVARRHIGDEFQNHFLMVCIVKYNNLVLSWELHSKDYNVVALGIKLLTYSIPILLPSIKFHIVCADVFFLLCLNVLPLKEFIRKVFQI